MKTKLKHFLASVTSQCGEFEFSHHALVKAATMDEACEMLTTVIKADNLEFEGCDVEPELRFSYFGHGTGDEAVHEKFYMREISAKDARILAKHYVSSYINGDVSAARAAIASASRTEGN